MSSLQLSVFLTKYVYKHMRAARRVARIGEVRNLYRILDGKPERTRPLGRCRCRWKNNIKIYSREVICETVALIQLP
jgi:hypothetical protein